MLAEGRRVLIDDPVRFEGVAVVGVDEHAWRHGFGQKYVTVIIDHPGPRRHRPLQASGHGPRPLEGGVQELARRTPSGVAAGVEVVAMDGFTGFTTVAVEELPEATAVMDPFHGIHEGASLVGELRWRNGYAANTRTLQHRYDAVWHDFSEPDALSRGGILRWLALAVSHSAADAADRCEARA